MPRVAGVVRDIVRLGDPVLREVARDVPLRSIRTARFQRLVDDLFATMAAADGVGLAAPQVGSGWRAFVYGAEPDIAHRVLINPVIEPLPGEQVEDWEGCLSIPHLRGLVPRHLTVRVRSLDREGRPQEFAATGFEARVIQHEIDHLDGIVFLDRMRDLQSLGFNAELDAALDEADPEP